MTFKKNKETRQAAAMHESYMNSNNLMIYKTGNGHRN